jgi:hypothetical protein
MIELLGGPKDGEVVEGPLTGRILLAITPYRESLGAAELDSRLSPLRAHLYEHVGWRHGRAVYRYAGEVYA